MNPNKQLGAVSLFVVVFAALLITVVTVGFVRIMLQDQKQASSVDLSQSAYDSAQAGVEDAKRALVRYQTICNGLDAGECSKAKAKLDSTACNEALANLKDVTINNGEVQVQEGASANKLDQAYTCVKIALDTIDYLGVMSVNGSKIIPLQVAPSDSFDTVKIEWFSRTNLPDSTSDDVDLQPISTNLKLLPQSGSNAWKLNRPAIMRAQLIQIGSNGFTLDDFDSVNASNQSNANTLFLYPTGQTGTASDTNTEVSYVGNDIRRDSNSTPLVPVNCTGTLSSGGYACSATIKLPDPINGGKRTAFLRLGTLYNQSNYRVTLYNSSDPIKFSAVQPEIDSTGRANDLFRRVKVRVELSDINFPYPDAAVDISGNFCKDFMVTDNVADYDPGTCKP
ncbi:MAG TPA: hypothetical protein PK543_02240 [Candidatus Saccharibacteria bacterium]|nr:hypothetical protein [Candidatus Saccharibacteria bacterium]